MDLDLGAGVEDSGKVIPEEELPFEALDINNLVQEEDLESVRTGKLVLTEFVVRSRVDCHLVDAWVIDLPDPKHTGSLLK